jgi:hypothetical protein
MSIFLNLTSQLKVDNRSNFKVKNCKNFRENSRESYHDPELVLKFLEMTFLNVCFDKNH